MTQLIEIELISPSFDFVSESCPLQFTFDNQLIRIYYFIKKKKRLAVILDLFHSILVYYNHKRILKLFLLSLGVMNLLFSELLYCIFTATTCITVGAV